MLHAMYPELPGVKVEDSTSLDGARRQRSKEASANLSSSLYLKGEITTKGAFLTPDQPGWV